MGGGTKFVDERLVSISFTSPRSVLSLYLSFPSGGRIAIIDIKYEVTNLAKRQPSLVRVVLYAHV